MLIFLELDLDLNTMELLDWKSEDSDFVETRASKRLEYLTVYDNRSVIVVNGVGGSGKTFLIRHEALRLNQKGYEIVIISDPYDMAKTYRTENKQVFVADNCFGSSYLHDESVQRWSNNIPKIKRILQLKDHILLLSSRLDVYKETFPNPFISRNINLSIVDLTNIPLTKKEQMLIAQQYIQPGLLRYINHSFFSYPYFPLLCKLARNKTNAGELSNLFTNISEYVSNDIDVMKNTSKEKKFASICLFFFF